MRFECEKCGRLYVADEKVRGRPFRMTCKKCGHLMVVKPATPPSEPAGVAPADIPLASPAEVELVLALEDEPTGPIAVPPRPPAPADGAAALDAARQSDPVASMAAELARELAHLPEAPPLLPRDPFLRPPPVPGNGARTAAKLSEADEVFADLSRQMEFNSGAKPLVYQGGTVRREPPPLLPPPPVAEERATPGPRPGRRWVAAAIGLGVGGIVAVAVALVVSSERVVRLASPARPPDRPAMAPQARAQVPDPPPAPAAALAAPAALPTSAPAPPPQAQPEVASQAPPARPAGEAKAAAPSRPDPVAASSTPRERERRPRSAPAQPVAAPRSQAVPSPPRVAAAPIAAPAPRPSHPAPVAPAPSSSISDRPLDEGQIAETIGRQTAAFETCVAEARRSEPQLLADARRVTITMTVNARGRALYPTLDDQELTGTELGSCLKREAGRMGFPEFAGDPVRVRVPLLLK